MCILGDRPGKSLLVKIRYLFVGLYNILKSNLCKSTEGTQTFANGYLKKKTKKKKKKLYEMTKLTTVSGYTVCHQHSYLTVALTNVTECV